MLARRLTQDDRAASDFVAAILLVAAVVVLGSTLSVLVGRTLGERVEPTDASFSLGEVEENDNAVFVTLQNGKPLPVDALRLAISRNASAETQLAPASWSTPNPDSWSPGEKLQIDLSADPVHPDEAIVIRVYRTDSNALIATLAARSGFPVSPIPAPTIQVPAPSPPAVAADATATSIVSIIVSHPEGTLAVTGANVDFGNVGGGKLLVTLNDEGREGDSRGGDGVWSALVRMPTTATAGTYAGIVRVTDASGRVTQASSPVLLTAVPTSSGGSGGGGGGSSYNNTTVYGNATVIGGNVTIIGGNNTYINGSGGGGSGNGTGSSGGGGLVGNFSGNGSGNFTGGFGGNSSGNFSGNGTGNFSGNFTGDIDGAFIGLGAGKRATEGTRFKGPTSTNVSRFELVNWSWDRLTPDELNYDALMIHVVAGNRTWSVYLKFDYNTNNQYTQNVPKITHMRIWNYANETWYKAATTLDLATLRLDLLNITSAQWTQLPNNQIPDGSYVNKTDTPGATYRYSEVEDNPFLVISFMRDEQATGQGAKSLDKGIFTVDVEFI